MTSHPQVGVLSLASLAVALARGAVGPGGWRPAFHRWVWEQSARHGSANLVLKIPFNRILLVNGAQLSAAVLREPPRRDRLIAGEQRRRAMAFLAPHALTISRDGDWERLRSRNEQVLAPGRAHDHRDAFLAEVHAAFAGPVGSADEVRRRMGRLMLGVVFGNRAPTDLPTEVAALMGVVKSPARRVMLGRLYRGRRRRFYAALRRQWNGAPATSLVGTMRGTGAPPSRESLEQVPHWMFTFVLSGTDLLTRTLAMIGSRPQALSRAREEIAAAGPLDDPATIDGLAYVEACLRETGRLFAPVTSTSHMAPHGIELDGHRIPARMRIVHYLPLTQRDSARDHTADDFVPERWLDPESDAWRLYPNLFLSGARECPGRDLIMFLCKSAIAIQLGRFGVRAEAPPLRADPLPLAFPARGLRFDRG